MNATEILTTLLLLRLVIPVLLILSIGEIVRRRHPATYLRTQGGL